MFFEDQSEYSQKPRTLIVHDPTEFDAFDRFLKIEDEEAFLAASLFREEPDVEELHRQHCLFVEVLKEHAHVTYLAEILGNSRLPAFRRYLNSNPNHLYTRDALVTLPWVPDGYILSNMRKPLRRDEPVVLAKVAEILGFQEILKIPSHLCLEGGDVMPFCYHGKRVLIMGYGPRTSQQTLCFLQETLVRDDLIDEIIGVNLIPWRLNLDGCFFPVSGDTIVAHPDSILGGLLVGRDTAEELVPIEYFKSLGFDVIEATAEESYYQQSCNFVCLGGKKLIAYDMAERTNKILRSKSFEVIGICGDQLVKGNGGPHCMTRPLYGS